VFVESNSPSNMSASYLSTHTVKQISYLVLTSLTFFRLKFWDAKMFFLVFMT